MVFTIFLFVKLISYYKVLRNAIWSNHTQFHRQTYCLNKKKLYFWETHKEKVLALLATPSDNKAVGVSC